MASATADDNKASLRENVVFYTTAFFCLVAIFSVFIFLFLVPFFIEPALATIYMEFDPDPVICQTTEASFHRGLSNCQWSSCREGCTKEVYECWHIRVRYRSRVPVGKADSRAVRDRIAQDKAASSSQANSVNLKTIHYSSANNIMSSSNVKHEMLTSVSVADNERMQSVLPTEEEADDETLLLTTTGEDGDTFSLVDEGGDGFHVHEARLHPNVKGCGYPPDVECNNTFAPTYGVVGANFSCYYSLIDPTLAITQLNIKKLRAELIYCLTIPIFLFVVSVVYLFYAYFKLYVDSPASALPQGTSAVHLSNEELENVEGVVICSSPSRFANKYGPLFQHSPTSPQQGSKGIVRRAKSGGHLTSDSLMTSKAAAGKEQMRTATVVVANKVNQCLPITSIDLGNKSGMRHSKSMGPQVGECSLAATQERRPSCFSSSSSSSSSHSPTTISASSIYSRSSSRTHLALSVSDSSSSLNASASDISIPSTSAEMLPTDGSTPPRNRNLFRDSSERNREQSLSPLRKVHQEERGRRRRERTPLIGSVQAKH